MDRFPAGRDPRAHHILVHLHQAAFPVEAPIPCRLFGQSRVGIRELGQRERVPGADPPAIFRAAGAGIEGDRACRRQLRLDQQSAQTHAGAELGREQQVVPADAAQAGQDRRVFEERAAGVDAIGHVVRRQAEGGAQPGSQISPNADKLAIAWRRVIVPPVELGAVAWMGQGEDQQGDGRRRAG